MIGELLLTAVGWTLAVLLALPLLLLAWEVTWRVVVLLLALVMASLEMLDD